MTLSHFGYRFRSSSRFVGLSSALLYSKTYDMIITGERRAEGGMRSVPRKDNTTLCFGETTPLLSKQAQLVFEDFPMVLHAPGLFICVIFRAVFIAVAKDIPRRFDHIWLIGSDFFQILHCTAEWAGFRTVGKCEWVGGTWEAEIPRIAANIPDRVSRLKCLGNAVVPQQFSAVRSSPPMPENRDRWVNRSFIVPPTPPPTMHPQ